MKCTRLGEPGCLRLGFQFSAQGRSGVVAADDQELRVGRVGLGQRLDEDVDALQLLQPADPEQDGGVRVETEGTARLGAVARMEELEVDAAGDGVQARFLGAVVAGEQVAFVAARRDDGVSAARGHALVVDTDARLLFADARAVLHLAEGVEHDDLGRIPGAGELHAGAGALPVVAVDDVVAVPLGGGEVARVADEFPQVLRKAFLLGFPGWACIDGHEPQVGRDVLDSGAVVVPAREDVDLVAHGGEFAGELQHIHVHAAGGAAPEGRQRAGVVADLCDACHGLCSIVPDLRRTGG
ncbi:MAG: hypothetical protein U5Q44_04595 [Dehalococcoidia bacterium]|nr:hypothetical protein [Dehalococcoidia bacterium]